MARRAARVREGEGRDVAIGDCPARAAFLDPLDLDGRDVTHADHHVCLASQGARQGNGPSRRVDDQVRVAPRQLPATPGVAQQSADKDHGPGDEHHRHRRIEPIEPEDDDEACPEGQQAGDHGGQYQRLYWRQPDADLKAIIPHLGPRRRRPGPTAAGPSPDCRPDTEHEKIERHQEHREEEVAAVEAGPKQGNGGIVGLVVDRDLFPDRMLADDPLRTAIAGGDLSEAVAVAKILLACHGVLVLDLGVGAASAARVGLDLAVRDDAGRGGVALRRNLAVHVPAENAVKCQGEARPDQEEQSEPNCPTKAAGRLPMLCAVAAIVDSA